MPAIKPIAEISKKWATVTPGRSGDYADGVANPKKDWSTQTSNASGSYKEGIQKSIANDSFAKGVKLAGSEKWKAKTIQNGVPRWGTGVANAEKDYSAGFGPFRDVIERTDLGPRFPRGDERNIERVKKMANALHKAKII